METQVYYACGQRFRVREEGCKVKRSLRGLCGIVLQWACWDAYVVSIDGEPKEHMLHESEMEPVPGGIYRR